jgi:hypothetical protein
MLQSILIGQTRGVQQGGLLQCIQYALHYKPLAGRMLAGLAVWAVAKRLEWTALANIGFVIFEIYISLIAIRFIAGILRRQVDRLVLATWLPIAVAAFAVYLLFINDQGRELGIGLMDANWKGLLLALVLIYWALNNWLSARIGLNREFPRPKANQHLLFWGPRLIGVAVHLLAAFSLSMAALSQHDSRGGIALVWVFAAPLAILLATAFVWAVDYTYLSERTKWTAGRRARISIYPIAAAEILLLVALVLAWRDSNVSPGFLLATLFITASAILYLGVISWLRSAAPLPANALSQQRDADRAAERWQTLLWTCGLALIMLLGTGAIWRWPMLVGQQFGSLTVACFAFGSTMALFNVLDLVATWGANHAQKAGFAVGSRSFAIMFVCFLVLPAFLTSFAQSFHRVRLCKTDCSAVAAPKNWSATKTVAARPTVKEAALAWYHQAEPAYHALHPDRPVPMLIVATAGGGIRAAYWTATVLERLESDLQARKVVADASDTTGPTQSLMHKLLFAISGVSGGSVGAAAYTAALQNHEVTGAAIKPTRFLTADFLAPGLASLIFIDGPSNVIPDFGQIDRGKALELGFELASRSDDDKDGLVSHSFLSFFPALDTSDPVSWRPALLLNATHLETGRRIITSHIKIERDIFVDSYDALHVLGSDVRLSTAAHNSARFTYVSPAGNLLADGRPLDNKGYVIDGGYFENYGAQTALELARTAIEAIDPGHDTEGHVNKVKLVVLQISSDPTLSEERTLVRAVEKPDGSCVVSSFAPVLPSLAASSSEDTDILTAATSAVMSFFQPSSSPAGSEPDPSNYLEVTRNEGEGFVLSPANELSAPLVGIMSVRQAHGTLAAAELAASLCQTRKAPQAMANSFKRQTANDATGSMPNVTATNVHEAPHFAHLAMCDKAENGQQPVIPPLGWVLSDITRDRFTFILKACGNGPELARLEEALGAPY